ncbi:Aconitase/3-isopropylmalate dehydratase large subunit alpha/beta/alpha subdomain 1/3 [Penicillium lagena]|uniref:Aconitase/3-isopropylmalate dehydratase large subunit alpha/beta/alpha subdomain 1/3 n=1 Tax=Penicillium lagena TaxID=94218 RepID=UPI0025409BC9|nr:Aconitase/3-isopropylmalate dehydratase large subunit alpha/beta/alpha subdomain 1/3 [Penicillium lagena]KAJ5606572.1 Aconitase/3-isopropylmalate dehydratase large subunit alpha/beta/alpha subdomain 1/3 [Penicillium lagena]
MTTSQVNPDEDDSSSVIRGREIIPGAAEGELVASKIALSFWGGVNAENGIVIDQHHPLAGQSISGKILAIPSGRGSCTGSGVVLELLLNGCQPSALIFGRDELILSMGVIVAEEMFQKSIPILQVSESQFDTVMRMQRVRIRGGQIQSISAHTALASSHTPLVLNRQLSVPPVQLTSLDQEMLDGIHGKAAQVAMRVIVRTAQIEGVTELIDVKQAHIDCCIYTGPGTLKFAEKLSEWGARVRIPTSLNSISIDRRLWRSLGVGPEVGEPSEQLAQAYVRMSARPTFTCAPYLLDTAPKAGENIIWAESNAVVFANSVLGARTIKCPDLLDVCVSLTGRSLNTGCHITSNRKAQIHIHLEPVHCADDTLFPLLGYLTGDTAANRIPIVTGLENSHATIEDLKAFGAAFATTSSAPMFHIAGITFEARSSADINTHLKETPKVTLTRVDLMRQWCHFNGISPSSETSNTYSQVDLISLGNPHFSYDEIVKLVHLCVNSRKNKGTALIVTCNRDTYARAAQAGNISPLEEFGVQILTDTCWCMIQEPIIPPNSRIIMTNSAKYAHYGKGMTGRDIRFGGLSQCVDAAISGQMLVRPPPWLQPTHK